MARSKADHPGGSPDRFLEERATTTVQGRDAPDLDAGEAAIRATLRGLTAQPGVYRMVDAGGDVLYVGKARNLRARVTNYTQVARLPRRLQRMVSQTRGMEVVTTSSEAEALLLEAQLIKRFRPPYNVLLRDDKSFPFIFLREDHAFPQIRKHRGARNGKGVYYGPFASAGAVTTTLNALQKVFLLRSCSDSFFANRSRPCLLHQIKRCSAPCTRRIDEPDYADLVGDAKAFLSGKSSAVHGKLQAAMAAAAANMDFELAAIHRDRLRALTHVQGGQALAATGIRDSDAVALASRSGMVSIQMFFVRGGQNWGHRGFFPAHTDELSDEEVLTSFLAQFYADLQPPREILLDRALPEAALIEEALSEKVGRRVSLRHARRGPARRLIAQAQRNAEEALARRMAESSTQAKLLRELADVLELPEPPKRIEVYDNSHIQGAQALGAMIVAGPEGFAKNQYRKFNMAKELAAGGDDFAMMKAMLGRRFVRLEREDPDRTDWPDLLLIDGGRGQVNAVKVILGECGAHDVSIVGVAKGPDRNAGREVFHLSDGRELTMPMNSPLLFYLQRLRDEAHRFVIGGHRQKRARAIGASPLDEIAGVGPARKRALLLHFGTSRAVRGASLEDLERAPGVSKSVARRVFGFYHAPG